MNYVSLKGSGRDIKCHTTYPTFRYVYLIIFIFDISEQEKQTDNKLK